MKFAFKFEYGSRFQRFEFRTFENSFSISRISNKTYRERWYTLKTSASLTVDDSGVYRSSSEDIGFTMGKTSQRFLSRDARQSLADSQSDYVYDYEMELNDLYGNGVYCTSDECGCGDRFCTSVSRIANAKAYTPPF